MLSCCLTRCDPMDCSPPGSSVHGFSQARILKWVAIPFSRGSSRFRNQTCISCFAGGFFTARSPGKSEHSYYCRIKRLWNRNRVVKTMGKESACSAGDWGWILEKEMASHSSVLAWKIPWTEEPDGLQSVGLQRLGHDWVTSSFTSLYLSLLSSRNIHTCCFRMLDVSLLVLVSKHVGKRSFLELIKAVI